MKLKRLNSWFAMIANLGVIAGLIFLSYEIRQNRLQMRAQASYSINEGISRLNAAVYNDPILANIVLKGEKDYFSLDSIERSQFIAFQFDRLNMAIHIEMLENDGIADVHFPYVEFTINRFNNNAGLQSFIVSIEDTWVGSKELYSRLRGDE